MKICLLTPVYEITTSGHGATPVVHYFAKEWAKMGHEVVVYNLEIRYPRFFYWLVQPFRKYLITKLGFPIPKSSPRDYDADYDGVKFHRRTMLKLIPHSRFSRKEITRILNIIRTDFDSNGIPDYFIGHWDNPQLELLGILKSIYHKPTALVLHSNTFSLEKMYGDNTIPLLKNLDIIGFRNPTSKKNFESKYFIPKRSFIAYSGVSNIFLNAGLDFHKKYTSNVSNFVYVGLLIERKYPVNVLTALDKQYGPNFNLTYIGEGSEKNNIISEYQALGNRGNVVFTGRIPRESIIEHLKSSDIFILISRAEVFGLVYLEAMSLGIIPIGSRGEGIDGIIIDGYNGFLCEPGNTDELEIILSKIKKLSSTELQLLSENAKKTAFEFSDKNVAEKYLNSIVNI